MFQIAIIGQLPLLYQLFIGLSMLLFFTTGSLSNDLQKALVHLIDHDSCDNLYSQYDIVEEAEICAGYIEGGVDSCQVKHIHTVKRTLFFKVQIVLHNVTYGFIICNNLTMPPQKKFIFQLMHFSK